MNRQRDRRSRRIGRLGKGECSLQLCRKDTDELQTQAALSAARTHTDTVVDDLQDNGVLGCAMKVDGDLSRGAIRKGMFVGVCHELVRQQRHRDGVIRREHYLIGCDSQTHVGRYFSE